MHFCLICFPSESGVFGKQKYQVGQGEKFRGILFEVNHNKHMTTSL